MPFSCFLCCVLFTSFNDRVLIGGAAIGEEGGAAALITQFDGAEEGIWRNYDIAYNTLPSYFVINHVMTTIAGEHGAIGGEEDSVM